MRRLFLVSFILLIGLGCNQPEQKPAADLTQEPDAREYEVFGMDCPGCHGGLEKLVKKIEGVRDAQANWQKQRLVVVVWPDAELDDAAIYDAIKRANFTAGKRIR